MSQTSDDSIFTHGTAVERTRMRASAELEVGSAGNGATGYLQQTLEVEGD